MSKSRYLGWFVPADNILGITPAWLDDNGLILMMKGCPVRFCKALSLKFPQATQSDIIT